MRRMIILLFTLLLTSIASNNAHAQTYPMREDSLTLYDKTRSRLIPVQLYVPSATGKQKHMPLVIISHGYHANREGGNKQYSSIANYLAANGYFVASIQHELPTDSLLPTTGRPYEVRMTNWLRGAENIDFVLGELKKTYKKLDYKQITLIGHSNGGDMSALFARQYPERVNKLITLDNRRMPLPVTRQPRIYSIRSSDQPADEGVLPTAELQKHMDITIVQLPNTIHNDMDDSGTEAQKKEINDYILSFLQNK